MKKLFKKIKGAYIRFLAIFYRLPSWNMDENPDVAKKRVILDARCFGIKGVPFAVYHGIAYRISRLYHKNTPYWCWSRKAFVRHIRWKIRDFKEMLAGKRSRYNEKIRNAIFQIKWTLYYQFLPPQPIENDEIEDGSIHYYADGYLGGCD